jgi:hypothetical protein
MTTTKLNPENLLSIIDGQLLLRCTYSRTVDVVRIWGATCHFAHYKGEQYRFPMIYSYFGRTKTKREDLKTVRGSNIIVQGEEAIRAPGGWWTERMDDPQEIFEQVTKEWPSCFRAFRDARPVVAISMDTDMEMSAGSLPLMVHYHRMIQAQIEILRLHGRGDGEEGLDGNRWTFIRRLEGFIASRVALWEQVGIAL